MSKINNTTAYATTTPTGSTILIGSEDSDSATRNYLVSALATYMSTNLTNLTLTGFLTVGGATTLSSTLDVTGNATIGGQLLVTGLLQVGSFTMTTVPTFFNGITALGGTTSLANTTVSGLPKLTGLSTFADNAAALGGGLVANDVYKTATGELRIVV